MNLVNKITFKTVCGAPEMVAVEVVGEDNVKKTMLRGVEKDYMRVVGIARKHEVVSSQYGDSVAFIGEMRAINLQTGEVFNGSKLFLPNVAESYCYNALIAAEMAEGFAGLEIAFDVGIKPSSTPMGYEYTVKPLIEQKAADRLTDILNSLPAPKQKTLPQPQKTGE